MTSPRWAGVSFDTIIDTRDQFEPMGKLRHVNITNPAEN